MFVPISDRFACFSSNVAVTGSCACGNNQRRCSQTMRAKTMTTHGRGCTCKRSRVSLPTFAKNVGFTSAPSLHRTIICTHSKPRWRKGRWTWNRARRASYLIEPNVRKLLTFRPQLIHTDGQSVVRRVQDQHLDHKCQTKTLTGGDAQLNTRMHRQGVTGRVQTQMLACIMASGLALSVWRTASVLPWEELLTTQDRIAVF